MIFIDSNVPMYLVGVAHPHKADAQLILEGLVAAKERLVCDAEVFQEILHRYVAIARREAIAPAFKVLLGIVDEVLPIERQDVLRAAAILSGSERQSARDALHIAVMERYGINTIFSFDGDFDRYPGLERISRT
ncbi:MAG: type II toxin-antitoxin system VapC family toxin [Bryobacteraceae bacterium]